MLEKSPFDLTLQECYDILKNRFVTNSSEVKYRNLTMLQAERLLGLRNINDHSSPKLYGHHLLVKIEEGLK
ncbi:hypothetical protein [Flammeovirga aprica]|uniref:Uncharacterized protein n=1 Tax=Flammeovirga aprica JL-4 TaxID=694437 RepID=A0A7X9RZ82_9BACT|nr:hypothetical protein [Flammeovirga aprica]NME71423.1 hypothetical protein [Flammeovirga aprica JL-4]